MITKKPMAKKKSTKPKHIKSYVLGKKLKRKKKASKRVKKRIVRVKKVQRRPKISDKRKIKVKPEKKVKSKLKPPVPDDTYHRTKITVNAIGGGGGSIISEIVSRIKKADFVVANTDSRALKSVKKAKRFQFGESLTGGLGTGMNVELGEMAAQAEKEKVKDLFKERDLCIIIACLGGGTGSGATPIFAKISRSSGCLTYGIFTLPFEFEGEKKMEIAKESLEKIKSNLNAYSVIPNERIFQIIDKNTPLKEALSAINKRLGENLEGLIEMIYLPGLINIDFADLKTILAGRGRLAYLNTIEIGEFSKEEAAKKVISTPLYPYNIKGARGILYNIVGGRTLQLSEVSQISKIISDSVNKNAKIIFGVSQSQKYQNKVKITLLATGCGTKSLLLKSVERPKTPTSPKKAKRKPKKPKTKISRPEVKPQKTNPPKLLKKKPRPKPQPAADQPKAGKPRPKPKKVSKPLKIKPKLKTGKVVSLKKKEVGLKTKPTPPVKRVQLVPIRKISTGGTKTRKPEKKPILPTIKPFPQKTEFSESERKIRRNALQLKKVAEEEEKELLEKEKIWETPAILRRKNNRGYHGN